MAIFTKDGLTLIPELMEDAILRANIMLVPVNGRAEISNVLDSMESLYASITDIHRASPSGRELILSQARLLTGEKVTIQVIGIRDENGWIVDVMMVFEPHRLVGLLSRQLSAVLHANDQAA